MTRLEAIRELSEMKTDAWIDERQMKALTMAIRSMLVIEDIKTEIKAIEINGYIDSNTEFIRTGEQVKNLVLQIIDKHIGRGEDIVEQ